MGRHVGCACAYSSHTSDTERTSPLLAAIGRKLEVIVNLKERFEAVITTNLTSAFYQATLPALCRVRNAVNNCACVLRRRLGRRCGGPHETLPAYLQVLAQVPPELAAGVDAAENKLRGLIVDILGRTGVKQSTDTML